MLSKPRKAYSLTRTVLLAAILAICPMNSAFSGTWDGYRTGGAIGFGGSGLQQAVIVNGTATVIQRSEGPGTISFFFERLMSDYFALAFEHTRGFSLAPFSMGSYFTGVAGRYYFLGPAPSVGPSDGEETVLVVRRFTPFAGIATGVAAAEIKRDNDLVPSVSASGVYIGFRFGTDYPLAPGFGIRPELIFSTTFFQNPSLPSTLSESSIQCGFYFVL